VTDELRGGRYTTSQELVDSVAIQNKAHAVALAMRFAGRRVALPETHITPARREGTGWYVPRYAGGAGATDATVLPDGAHIGAVSGFALRGYQRKALAAWWRHKSGIIVAPCGAGKTAIGLTAVLHLDTPALVLVHTGDLLQQWRERAEALGIPTTIIAEGLGPVSCRLVIATMQTLSMWPRHQLAEWGKGFGLVIADEAHHVPCATLTDVLYELPGRYRLGLTATPTRADGLTPILLGHMGPIRATVSREALAEAGAIIVPRVERIATAWAPDEDFSSEPGIDYVQMITDATEEEARNIQIADLAAEAVKAGRHVLIQTERVEHAKVLSRLIGDRHGLGSVAVYGAMGAKARALALSQVASGACPILIATQLADEGLDLPILDTLILGVPQRNAARLEQRVGRIARPAPGKVDAIVYDLLDGGAAARFQWARLKVYRMMGCQVSG
jgi:superfamily II DNA or RNA helicase